MKYLNLIINVFINVYKEHSLIKAFFISIIFFIGLLSLLISALQIFMPFTYIAF